MFTSVRLVDGRPRKVIVDDTGKIVNKSPTEEELKGLKKEPYIVNFHQPKKYTDKELDYHLIRFFVENGRPPTEKDFSNNSEYPNHKAYINRFRTWPNALKRVGLDVESMVKKGVLVTSNQKGRFAEIIIRDHFKKNPVDLAEENRNSHCDGICPNGMSYDVKSSKFYGTYWSFGTNNKYKEKIEIYYFLAFNEDYTELKYVWRVSAWEIVEKDNFYVGLNYNYEFNVKNMKKYDITDKVRDVLKKYEFFNKSEKTEIKVTYNIQLFDGYITV